MPDPIAITETVTEPANLSLAALGQRMSKSRKGASASVAPTVTAPGGDDTAAPVSSSEQTTAEGDEVLSQVETADSAALADVAEAETETTEETPETETETTEVTAEAAPEKAPKAVRDLQKRVGKVTEQRNEAREEVEYWKKKATAAEAIAASGEQAEERPSHPGDAGFNQQREVQEFDRTLNGVEHFLTWADANAEGGTYQDGGKSYDLSAEDVRAYKRKSESERVRVAAKREAKIEALRGDFESQRKAAHVTAARLYPWIEQKASPEFQEAVTIIRENPGVLERPDFELVVARQVAGQRLEREAVKKIGVTKPARVPAPVVARTESGRVATPPPGKATATAAETQFQTTGKFSDLSKMLASQRAARLAATT